MPPQSPCQYTKYCLRAFHCLNAFLLRQNCLHLTALDFSSDFWFLRRRCVVTHQGEKGKKHLAHSMQSPAKRVCMEKEEGDCIVQLLPRGGSGTVQASSDAVRRVRSCQLMVWYHFRLWDLLINRKFSGARIIHSFNSICIFPNIYHCETNSRVWTRESILSFRAGSLFSQRSPLKNFALGRSSGTNRWLPCS